MPHSRVDGFCRDLRSSERPRVRWMMAAVLALLLVIAALAPTHAQAEEINLQRLTSRFYTIFTNLPTEEARALGQHMDIVFGEYQRRFTSAGFTSRDDSPMPLYLFRRRSDYHSFLASHNVNSTNTDGMFFVRISGQGLVTWTQGRSRAQVQAVLQHEGFHQFAHRYIGSELPIWINEGLAQYYEDGVVVGDRFVLNLVNHQRVESVKSWMKQGRGIDMERLLTMTSSQWHRTVSSGSEESVVLYDQAWSMVYYLINAEGGRHRTGLERYMVAVGQGKTSLQAWREAFATLPPQTLKVRWQSYAASFNPDAVAVATSRMEFLGQALRYLHEQTRAEQPVASIETLRGKLEQIQFKAVLEERGLRTQIAANDEWVYRFNSPEGKPQNFQLVQSGHPDLPPSITAPGLSPQPTLVWMRDADGQLVYDLVYR